ncbi:Thiol-disulfide isomerase or thioredoxin [Mucilaginibacter pineti]|uniref:Thiol-disulfide isomerase or thioredoxin n=1 Tax=Mucilaginibacter pineti TaxID=1391627 RepID=A0A1G7GHJ8_9SPHI|nr:TlpA disulfide reductase family protein [Mucilaginibacter pineti]SDE87571.1 Thiol-disulfide isomerase or thioredoxin [Mucilaginibacter pineti]
MNDKLLKKGICKKYCGTLLLFWSVMICAVNMPTDLAAQKINNSTKQATLSIILSFLNHKDSAILTINKWGLNQEKLDTKIVSKINAGRINFLFPLEHASLINISLPNNGFINNNAKNSLDNTEFIICPGDKVQLVYNEGTIVFTGKNSATYNCQYQLASFEQKLWAKHNKPQVLERIDLKAEFNFRDSVLFKELEFLKPYQDKIPKIILARIRSDLFYSTEGYKYSILNLKRKKASDIGYDFNNGSKIGVNVYSSIYSSIIPPYVVEKFKNEYGLMQKKDFKLGQCFNYVNSQYSGDLKEQILTYLLLKNINSDSLTTYRNIALNTFKNDSLKNILFNQTDARVEGNPAYNFTLPGEDDKSHSLSDYKGKIVVLDFWFTGCGACTQLKPKLEMIEHEVRNSNVVFINISIDKDRDKWLNSIKSEDYTVGNSVKLYTGGLREANPVIKYYGVKGYPTIVLIGADGALLRNVVDPRLDNGKDMLALIKGQINKTAN